MSTRTITMFAILLLGATLRVTATDPETGRTEPQPVSPDGAYYDSTIARMISYIHPDSLAATIRDLEAFGTRRWDRPNRDTVCTWIVDRFTAIGVADVRRDTFIFNSTLQQNVVATIPGNVRPDIVLVVGGHYDSQSSNPADAPGADDNASGTAAAIEMARILTASHYEPAVTLRFIAFAAEEAGLIGSKHYAQTAKSEGATISAMLNYDMIGYRNQGSADRDVYLIWYEGAIALADLHAAMALSYTTLTPVYTTMYRSQSDSWPFFQQGYPAVFSIERDFNPSYHTPGDTADILDMPYAADIVRSGLATLLTLDQIPLTPTGLHAEGIVDAVRITWHPNTESDLEGYHVYRREDSQSTYVRLTVEPFSDTVWVDTLRMGGMYLYRISAVDIAGLESSLSDSVQASPLVHAEYTPDIAAGYRLEPNYPNPFNPVTTIQYAIPRAEQVTIIVYTTLGEEVRTLINGLQDPGYHAVVWDAAGMSSGVYLVVLRTPTFYDVQRMVLTR